MATKIVLNKKKASDEFGIIGIQSFNNKKKTAEISVTGSCVSRRNSILAEITQFALIHN